MLQRPLQESQGIYPQSDPIALSARLPLLPGTRLHAGILLALAGALVLWHVFARTVWGFRLRAVGLGPRAAEISGGIDGRWTAAAALALSGAIAGLAGGVEVAGVSYALFQNLSPGYGFTAIAVALLGRLHPLGVVLAGLLFGALEAGAGAMQRVARAAGVPTRLVRVGATLIGGGFAGLAGATLVLAQVGTFAERMTAGRGYVALAIVVLGRWHPLGAAVAALAFGAAMALQFLFQTLGLDVPYQLFLMLPYVLALLALAGVVGSVRAPADLGRP
ncbi:MAG: hypothetical protein H0X69_01230 [Gemmatimonadales bacterium]|nr:hypothetical protein [Gemmatimonadales bacterium]